VVFIDAQHGQAARFLTERDNSIGVICLGERNKSQQARDQRSLLITYFLNPPVERIPSDCCLFLYTNAPPGLVPLFLYSSHDVLGVSDVYSLISRMPS